MTSPGEMILVATTWRPSTSLLSTESLDEAFLYHRPRPPEIVGRSWVLPAAVVVVPSRHTKPNSVSVTLTQRPQVVHNSKWSPFRSIIPKVKDISKWWLRIWSSIILNEK